MNCPRCGRENPQRDSILRGMRDPDPDMIAPIHARQQVCSARLPGQPEAAAAGRGPAEAQRGDRGAARGGSGEAEGGPEMERRTFLAMVSGSFLAAPLAAEAQQPGRVYHVGAFHVGVDHVPPSLDPLRDALKGLGYEDGQSLRFDWRNLPDEEAGRDVAKQFVRNRVDLIIAFENQTIRAANVATTHIPVVFVHATDPVESGFVKSMAYPGGNLTGFAGVGDVPGKWMQLFREVVPRLRRVLVLFNPRDLIAPRYLRYYRKAAASLNLQLVEREVIEGADIERIVSSLKRGDVDGMIHGSPDIRAKFSGLLTRLGCPEPE